MPNHIANKLIINGNAEELARLIATIETPNEDEGKTLHIDFNNIIPMPEDLTRTETRSKVYDAVVYALTKMGRLIDISKVTRFPSSMERITKRYGEKQLGELYEIGKTYVNLFDTYGYINWYEWSLNNWGTKWNAYDTYIECQTSTSIEMYFNTAWSGVPLVIKKLAEMFPTLQFIYKYSDEDMGYNCGMGISNNGLFSWNAIEGGSDEAMQLYIECHQQDEDDFYKDDEGKWHNRNWEWDEDEEED